MSRDQQCRDLSRAVYGGANDKAINAVVEKRTRSHASSTLFLDPFNSLKSQTDDFIRTERDLAQRASSGFNRTIQAAATYPPIRDTLQRSTAAASANFMQTQQPSVTVQRFGPGGDQRGCTGDSAESN